MSETPELETYWNGKPTPCARVKIVVGDTGRFRHYWARTQGLVGTIRDAVRVGDPDGPGEPFYIDNEHGGGWAKVTIGKGAPSFAHQTLDVERELVDEDTTAGVDLRPPADLEPLGERDYDQVRAGIFAIAKATAPMPLEMIDRAIRTAEIAEAAGPLVDAHAARQAAGGLDLELRMFRAFRAYAARLAALRPEAEARAAAIHEASKAAGGNGAETEGGAASSLIIPHHSTREDPDAN